MEQRVWKDLMERYGQPVTLIREDGDVLQVRAFFQPVRERGVGEEPTPLGMTPVGKYLYLGPADVELDGVRELVWNGHSYRFIQTREVPMGAKTAYRRAIAEEWEAAV